MLRNDFFRFPFSSSVIVVRERKSASDMKNECNFDFTARPSESRRHEEAKKEIPLVKNKRAGLTAPESVRVGVSAEKCGN